MKLDQLRYFVKVVESHSFNQAAKELYMTQPALTASIRAFEEELEVILLHRSKKGAYPTEYGLQVYYDCKTILDSLEQKIEIWQSSRKERERISGVVHLAAIPVACNFMLEDIIWGIQKKYPEINISLHEVSMLNFSSELMQGHYNIGITAVNLEDKEQDLRQYDRMNFHSQVLLKDEYRIFLSTKHPYASKLTLNKDEYESLELITYSKKECIPYFQRFLSSKQVHYLNSLGNILQSIAENKGAGIFLHQMLKNNWYVKNNHICVKSLNYKSLGLSEHYLVWADESSLSRAEKAVVQFIQENYAKTYNLT